MNEERYLDEIQYLKQELMSKDNSNSSMKPGQLMSIAGKNSYVNLEERIGEFEAIVLE